MLNSFKKNSKVFLESNYTGPGLFDYHLQKNEYLAQDKDLCNAYDNLQKDCTDLKRIMEVFANEIYVSFSSLKN